MMIMMPRCAIHDDLCYSKVISGVYGVLNRLCFRCGEMLKMFGEGGGEK